ncbi:MAG: hypothetical protein FJ206_05245 [Gemmatimonadetes bacterium]|nr:hypothetical protein [Gemmatimonadota bacterium]
MARIILTAQVENSAKWETMFRTHGELLRSMGTSVTYFATNDDNEVALYAEPPNLDHWFAILKSPDTAAAMAVDGVKRETVKVFVLDKEFRY